MLTKTLQLWHKRAQAALAVIASDLLTQAPPPAFSPALEGDTCAPVHAEVKSQPGEGADGYFGSTAPCPYAVIASF